MSHKIPSAIEQAIVDDYRRGTTIASMMKLHGFDKRTIYNVLIRKDVHRRRRPGARCQDFGAEDMARMAELRKTGYTKEQLADEFHAGNARIVRALVELGLDAPLSRRRIGRVITPYGYARVWVDPNGPWAAMRGSQGTVFEHRVVMADKIGRVLSRTEHVHHINGDKLDNRPENLELWTTHHPKGQRHDDPPHCQTCTCSQ